MSLVNDIQSSAIVMNWNAKTATTINLNMLKYGWQSQFSDILNYFNQIVRIWWSDWWLGQLVLELLYKLFETFLESIAYSWIPLLQPITYNLCIEKYSICAINNNFFTYAGAGKQGVLWLLEKQKARRVAQQLESDVLTCFCLLASWSCDRMKWLPQENKSYSPIW